MEELWLKDVLKKTEYYYRNDSLPTKGVVGVWNIIFHLHKNLKIHIHHEGNIKGLIVTAT